MKEFSKKMYVSDQEIRWCKGCGNYAIISTIQKIFAKHKIPRENICFVSGIGCSSRLPYYMNTYGFHTIHGRATAVASGLKLTRPDLSVWVATGDGDALSIGLHHLIHLMRKNINVNILLFNNRIYGLTKGQVSPTSKQGKITKSTPFGSIETPINPLNIALASDCTFIARVLDVDIPLMESVLKQAMNHNGTSFIEIIQNCVVFNDEDYLSFADKNIRENHMVFLENKKPLIYGKDKNKVLNLSDDFSIVSTDYDENKTNLLYKISEENINLAQILSNLPFDKFPMPFGIFRKYEKPTFEDKISDQNKMKTEADFLEQKENLQKFYNSGFVWQI